MKRDEIRAAIVGTFDMFQSEGRPAIEYHQPTEAFVWRDPMLGYHRLLCDPTHWTTETIRAEFDDTGYVTHSLQELTPSASTLRTR